MKEQENMSFREVEFGFQIAFQAAWEAYIGGSIPIGAVVLNQKSEVVSIGRNRIYEESAPSPQIFRHQLAHAEANAILQLSEDDYPDIRSYTLYSVMEPCPFCFGAVVMGSIKNVKFAARDGWGGATSLVDKSNYLINKRLHIEGPFNLLEKVQLAWQTCFELEKGYSCKVMDVWRSYCPEGVEAGEKMHHLNILRDLREKRASVDEVFDVTIKMFNSF
jgi:tRNA(adenine34) deaminase